MDEWRTIALADLCDDVQYGVTASASADLANGPLLLRITDIVPPRIDWGAVPTCDVPEDKIGDFELRDGDIVVARTGATVGYAKHVKRPPARALFASYLVRFRVGDGADPAYVGHVVQSAAYKNYVAAHAGGSAQPNANAKVLGSFPIALPDKPAQRRIASILSGFDELIEINERRIELLEDLARSLYREWFVHFRFPGHEDVELVDSELGPIPEGWEVLPIDDVAPRLTRGIAPNYADDGGWTVINQRCIRDQRVMLALARRHKGAVSDAKELRFADVLINSTGVGTLGRVAMLLEENDTLTADSHVTIARAASPDFQPWFGLHMLSRETTFQAMGIGSTGQTELGRTAVGALPVAVPPPALLEAFAGVVWPLLRPLSTLSQSGDLLAATRDLLLPRLVSGRLDISDIDLGVLTPLEVE